MCRELTNGINLVDILRYGAEFNPHLMALHSLPPATAWGVTAVQVIPFSLGRSRGEGIISDRVFVAPRGAAWDTGSHWSLSVKMLANVFLAILAPSGGDMVTEMVNSA